MLLDMLSISRAVYRFTVSTKVSDIRVEAIQSRRHYDWKGQMRGGLGAWFGVCESGVLCGAYLSFVNTRVWERGRGICAEVYGYVSRRLER